MRADKVGISWDLGKSEWLVRIESGDEVIRRHYKAPKNSDEQKLLSQVLQIVHDEGYEAEPAQLHIQR